MIETNGAGSRCWCAGVIPNPSNKKLGLKRRLDHKCGLGLYDSQPIQ